MDMFQIVVYAVLASAMAGLGLFGWRYWRSSEPARTGGGPVARRERRLGLIEATSIGADRRLMLVRRDNIEHLILIGGPIDLVIESGIEGHREAARQRPPGLRPEVRPQTDRAPMDRPLDLEARLYPDPALSARVPATQPLRAETADRSLDELFAEMDDPARTRSS